MTKVSLQEYPGYFAGEDGNIYDPYGQVVKWYLDRYELKVIIISDKEGRWRHPSVAHLILEAFVKPKPSGKCDAAGFKNGNKQDTSAKNLEWRESKRKKPITRRKRFDLDEITAEIRQNIIKRRKRLGLSMRGCAHIIAVDPATWRYYEHEMDEFRLSTILQICFALTCKLEDIIPENWVQIAVKQINQQKKEIAG